MELATGRHTLGHSQSWSLKTNARRSGMCLEIREAILGHAQQGKSVTERFGRIGDEELVSAIGSMAFDKGDTEILLSNRSGKWPSRKKCTKKRVQRKSG
jgi:hypothetical protein